MKYSQFNSIIPYNNKYALYNTFNDSVIILEEELRDLVEAGIKEDISSLKEYHPTFYDYLCDNKYIIDDKIDEVEQVKEIVNLIDRNESVFRLTVNPTMNCNFKCWYCYETHIKDSKIEYSVLDAIKKFITNKVLDKNLKLFEISFFGGEPLLYFKKNVIPILDHLKDECIKNDVIYAISFTTNGYLINQDFIDYFIKNEMSCSIQITFDGHKEEHDKVRFVSKTRGSYDKIVDNIKKLLKYECFSIRARVNYTDLNIHNSFQIVNDFDDISLSAKKERILFDFHRVWQNDRIDDTDKYLIETTKKMKKNGFNTNTHFSPNNVKDSCYADKLNSVTINYNGDLYKCTARDFLSENRVGTLTEEGVLLWENNHQEKRINIKFKNKPCLTCRLMPICNGGCSQHALEFSEKNEEYCIYGGDEKEKDKVIFSKIEDILNV